MFGSLDCMYWMWKKCPTAWQGQFQNKDGCRSVILEAIVDQFTWIWHTFFGLPRGNNDINVLDKSSLMLDILCGEGPQLLHGMLGAPNCRLYDLPPSTLDNTVRLVVTIGSPLRDLPHGSTTKVLLLPHL